MKIHKNIIRGFSLIELSLTLVVFSSIAVMALSRMTTERDGANKEQAISDLKTIKNAIEYFARTRGYYPCPASNTVAETDSSYATGARDQYGMCSLSGTENLAYSSPTNIDNAVDMITYRNSTVPSYVVRGAVPCKDIGLPITCGTDPYGNKYSYFIVPALASSGNPNAIAPATDAITTACAKALVSGSLYSFDKIRLLKDYITDLSTSWSNFSSINKSPDFAVVYYGKDGIGAYNLAGNRVESTEVSSVKIDNNIYQDINNDIENGIDEYLFSPTNPLDPAYIFGDIVIYGNDITIDQKVCVKCGDCVGESHPTRVVAVDCYGCTNSTNTCTATATSNLCD